MISPKWSPQRKVGINSAEFGIAQSTSPSVVTINDQVLMAWNDFRGDGIKSSTLSNISPIINTQNNLLIVFGGTLQSEPQTIFTDTELSNASVDVLQINLLTINSNIAFTTTKNEKLNGKWLQAEPSVLLRNLEAKRELKNLDGDANNFLSILDDMGKVIEEINWSHTDYTENSDARGMTEEAFNKFSKASQELILNFLIYLKKINYEYGNVLILAHSRGCSLAINTLSKSNTDKELNDVLIQKLKRVVLLDPVGKNVNSTDKTIIPKNAETIKYLSEIGKEIHIIVKSKSSNYDYECFADVLVGTKEGGHINSDSTKSPNIENVFVHIAHMAHEGMLANKFRTCFVHYMEIINEGAWKDIYSNEQKVDLMKMRDSSYLADYIKGQTSVSEITITPGDVFHDFFIQFEVSLPRNVLKDRRRAFVHCVAKKIEIFGKYSNENEIDLLAIKN